MGSHGQELTFGDEQRVNGGAGAYSGGGRAGGATGGPLYPTVAHAAPDSPQLLYPYLAPPKAASKTPSFGSAMEAEGEGMRPLGKVAGSYRERPKGAEGGIRISVTAPLKQTRPSFVPGINEPYYTYLVNTSTTLSSFSQPETSVRRRFRDFVDLAKLLKVNFRGYFLPQRPHRNAFQGKIRMSPSFIEERRANLEKYLNQLAEHPDISNSEELRVFLEAHGHLRECVAWIQLHPVQPSWVEGAARLVRQITGHDWVPTPTEVAQQPSAKRHMVRALRESFKSIKERRQPTMEYSPAEAQLRQETEVMDEFQRTVEQAWNKASYWMDRFESVGRALDKFGSEMNALSNFEMDSGYVRIPATAGVGRGCVEASALHRQFANQTAAPLSHIHEYQERMGNVLGAFRSREKALMTLHTLGIDIDRKKQQLKQLEVTVGKASKVQSVEHDIRALEAAKAAAQTSYDKLAGHNAEELARFREARGRDWADMLRGFAATQAAYATHLMESWCQVAEGLGVDAKVLQGIRKA
eukprot:evm.model.scf_3971.1 EVM.evm.TU.scf_3971.1   scf_3971:176-5910(+)